jgi:branched-chain amino acid transport system ATP-binding protein
MIKRGGGAPAQQAADGDRLGPERSPLSHPGQLVVRDLKAFYGPAQALHGVDVTLEQGEALGVVGNNGAGKTTLLRTIAGLHRKASGDVVYDGHRLLGRAPDEVACLGIGLVRDGGRVFENLTIKEHLMLAEHLGRKRGHESRGIDELLDLFPLLASRGGDTKAGYLSGGQRQVLCLAMAVGGGAKCLLLDEPSAGLAESTAEEVFRIIRGLADQGMTLFIVEQDVRWLQTLVDRVAELEMGRISGEVSAASRPDRPDRNLAVP